MVGAGGRAETEAIPGVPRAGRPVRLFAQPSLN